MESLKLAIDLIKLYKELLLSLKSSVEYKFIDRSLSELETLQNRSCDNCKYLDEKEKNLKFECLIEVCRTCSKSNIDNWEQK